jgi:hypothetical protein
MAMRKKLQSRSRPGAKEEVDENTEEEEEEEEEEGSCLQ